MEKLKDLYPRSWEVMKVNCVSKNSGGNLAAWERAVNLEVSLDMVSLATRLIEDSGPKEEPHSINSAL